MIVSSVTNIIQYWIWVILALDLKTYRYFLCIQKNKNRNLVLRNQIISNLIKFIEKYISIYIYLIKKNIFHDNLIIFRSYLDLKMKLRLKNEDEILTRWILEWHFRIQLSTPNLLFANLLFTHCHCAKVMITREWDPTPPHFFYLESRF